MTIRTADLIGRDAELESLVSRLGIATASDDGTAVRAVLLGGDAGVGKTRVLQELRDRARAAGWRVVAGHCLDLADGSLPYLPFSEILGLLDAEDPEVTGRVIGSHPTLARLLPGRRVRPDGGRLHGDGADPAGDTTLQRGDVYSAVQDLLTAAADEAPLLVVVEDAHWADESTRDLLSVLFAREAAARVAIVVSYRSDDLHRRHPLRRHLAEWGRLRAVERLQLEPLGTEDVRRLVKALRPGTLSEAEFASIADRAEGIPFFAEELVGASWSGSVPTELADLLLLRLDGLDDTARHLLRLASAAGRQVSHALLAEVSDLDDRELEAGLRAAVEAHLLETTSGGSYAFRHALLGEAVYDDLLPGERTRLHRRFVEALDGGGAIGTSAELAQHARLAGDSATALRAEVAAGEEALAVGGSSEAAAHFLEALDLVARDPAGSGLDLSALTRRAAGALVAAGRVSRAATVLRERLDALPADAPADERGPLLTSLAGALLRTDTEEDPLETATAAVQLLRDGSPRLLARALAVRAECLVDVDDERARADASEGLALAEQHDLTRVVVDLTTTLAYLESGGRVADLRDVWDKTIGRAREAGVIEPELRGLYFLGRLLHDRGEMTEAARVYAELGARARDAGLEWSPFPSESRLLHGVALTHLGRLDEAWRLLDVTGQRPPAVYEWLYFAHQVHLRFGLRGVDHRGDAFDRVREHWRSDGLTAIIAGGAEVLHDLRRGDVAHAHAVYDEVVAVVVPMWHEWFQARLRLTTWLVGGYASAAPQLSARERAVAGEAVAALMADGDRVIDHYAQYEAGRGPEYQAWVARRAAEHLRWRWLAQVDPPAAAELVAAWRDAEAAFVAFGSVPDLAATRARLAGVLRATGDAAGAREAAREAREVATALGLQPVLDELGPDRAPRADDGAGGPHDEEAPRASLTPREVEILRLVAQGRTNGEIGRQLFIATKTVSVHVSNLLGKLEASSRTEAAAVGRRLGLVD